MLPDGDRVLVHCQVIPSGFRRGGGGDGVDGRLVNLVTSAGNQLRAEHLVTVPRTQVASIVDTGTTAQGGVPVARIAFADGSFADQRLISKPGPDSWAVASTL